MVTLRRTVRFWINLDAAGRAIEPGPSYNAYAGHPSSIGLGRFFQIEVACRSEPDPRTGYVINIKDIDDAVRRGAVPVMARACAAEAAGLVERPATGQGAPGADPVLLLPELVASVQEHLPVACESLTLCLSPYYRVVGTPDRQAALLVRTFDMAASHRLNCSDLSPEQNLAIFGKCNLPSGHGHNYKVEPRVSLDLATLKSHPFSVQALDRITDRTIIQRFDHKHLNLDTPEFAESGGVNPSVENIARVFFDLLEPEIRAASPGARLESITVWETDRTCATYPG